MKKKKINNKKIILFFVITSFLILMFTSKWSPLYPFNDWQDANSFLTVARSMLNGNILYKDIIEQKGPILYLIYIIGYLIAFKNSIGIFFMEVISLSIFSYFCYKIVKLYINNKYGYLFIPLLLVAICTSYCFVHGGSAEEFCLPFIAISMYYFLYHLKEKKLSYFQIFVNALLCGCVAMIKFNIIGFWFGFMAFIFFDLCKDKEYKRALLSCIVFLGGMFVPIILCLIYFIINNAVPDFIFSYFTINIGSYTKESPNAIIRIFLAIRDGLGNLSHNHLLIIAFPFLIYFVCKLSKSKRELIGISTLFITTLLGIYIGLRSYKYYSVPLAIFYIFIIIYLVKKYDKYIINVAKSNKKYFVLLLYIIVIGLSSYTFANYRSYIGTNKEDYAQYQIAEIIKNDKETEPIVLNYGYLDYGIYNILDIVPNCKYFHRMNISYDKLPDNYEVQRSFIRDKKVNYVVVGVRSNGPDINEISELQENYEVIYEAYQNYESYIVHFYLLKIK